ncbi:MAG: response regulator [Robiginitomaculum sp.]|nr:response regulator [Robiginitomaculum sp.]
MVSLSATLSKLQIMIVDDHDFLCGMLVDMMRGFGAYNTHTAKNGEDAVRMMGQVNPDVIFTDLNMEPMNGFELTKWIRRSPQSRNSEIPIILLTGSSDMDTIISARDCGISEIIIKPIVPQQVLSRLNAVLTEPRTFIRGLTYIGPDRRRRDDPKYKGEMRRLDDPTGDVKPADIPTLAEKTAREGIRTLVMSLVQAVAQLDPLSKESLSHLSKRIAHLKELGGVSNNPPVVEAILSLEGYVTSAGANDKLAQPLLREHLKCIAVLSSPSSIDLKKSDLMLNSLRQNVFNNSVATEPL